MTKLNQKYVETLKKLKNLGTCVDTECPDCPFWIKDGKLRCALPIDATFEESVTEKLTKLEVSE